VIRSARTVQARQLPSRTVPDELLLHVVCVRNYLCCPRLQSPSTHQIPRLLGRTWTGTHVCEDGSLVSVSACLSVKAR
jgi:hypothetical protein